MSRGGAGNDPRDESVGAKGGGGITRRTFFIRSAVGVGLVMGSGWLGKGLARRYMAGMINTLEPPYPGPMDPGLWFEIRADDSLVLYSPKVEMGQGTFTGLAQIAADELEVDIGRIRVVHAPSASGNVDPFATGGSTSISSLWEPLREIAATMREMVRREAAARMGVDPASVELRDGAWVAGDLTLTWGEVVGEATEWELPDTPELKGASEYRYIGQPVPRVDLHEKVFAAPIFGMDAEMPEMLFGSVVRADRIGARMVSADGSAAEGMPGVVQVVIDDDFVGVVAESYTAAERAREAIKVEWEVDRSWTTADVVEMLRVGQGDAVEIQREGDAEDAFESGEVISAEYESPIGAHAQLEPAVAVAHVTEGGVEVITSTQVVAATRKEVADGLGFDEDQVDVRPAFLGGGFGRRLHTPIALDAARLSRAVGRPVKCALNRKDEFRKDTFRPPTHHLCQATLTSDGAIEAIEHNVSSGDVAFGSPLFPAVAGVILGADLGAWRGGMIQYGAIPNHRAVSWRVKLPFATSWWRSLGLLANTFAIESFVDELAERAGRDPVEFRLAHIQDDERGRRLAGVIRAAADTAGWTTEVRDGVAMGFAASTDANTPVAQVAEVSIDEGEIRVHRVFCAIDPGLAVNPDQVRAQCEGGIIMGLSAALLEEMTIEDGMLEPTIYGPYRMATLRHAPRDIQVTLLQGTDEPGAVGEPPLGPIGAAVANAVARLTGVRLRRMPLQQEWDARG